MSQHSEVEHNSSSSSPHLLLKETQSNDFVRLWFQNNATDKWAFNAKPQSGSMDNQNIISEPIIFAWNSDQKFAIGGDGTVRINKEYTLPNTRGTLGQVLAVTDDTNTDNYETGWVTPGGSCEPQGILIDQLPFTITESGNYYLEEDLTIATGSNGIIPEAPAEFVNINLNGYTIDGANVGLNGTKPVTGITMNVYNGKSKNWTLEGISIFEGNVENVEANDCRTGIEVLQEGNISHCTASDNTDTGMQIGKGIIKDCTSKNNPYGFHLIDGIAKNCVAQSNTIGFYVNEGLMSECVASENTTNGVVIVIGGGTVVESRIFNNGSGSADSGINVVGKGRVVNCDIYENNGNGITCHGASKAYLINNFVYENQFIGISFSTTNGYWKENVITENTTNVSTTQPIAAHSIGNIVD